MKVNEFTEKDWSAFAGSEPWFGKDSAGYEPLIGEGIFENETKFCLVLDRTGGCVLIDGDVQNNFGGYVLTLEFPTQAAALAFAEGIGEPKSLQDFLCLGFREI